ncbi:MAG TPA: sulfite exporter TauE/SafE family protein [Candidatus Competibacteraceae bacterium]|nr:MAG: sulfite exporter TauE/SafE family protein [Candidatus Competibacteraceae bacterium]HNW77524.1 sulfite exporter TauE/SafE family protein [Candidatus Competibacteraceae bacterium]HQC72992.1 sulfite exporter TauE/SafE family protein [Candidatus Competibacteraceae bacterium]
MSESVLLLLFPAAFLAGLVDAVVGGGGLIQIPALFAVESGQSPATLFGTNKFASVFGTANAAWRYAWRVRMPWGTTLPAALAAFAFSYLGAAAVAWLPRELLRPLILLLLLFAAGYTLWHKDLGRIHRPAHSGRRELLWATLLGALIGFYDGFFGPGTGSFLIFLFVRFFGFDFLHASAAAKVVNVATNLAALGFFLPHGHWLPPVAVGMALCNVGGSLLGTRLALQHGSGFVRRVFLLVVGALILKFAWDTFR